MNDWRYLHKITPGARIFCAAAWYKSKHFFSEENRDARREAKDFYLYTDLGASTDTAQSLTIVMAGFNPAGPPRPSTPS
jgi:hypothetical protein